MNDMAQEEAVDEALSRERAFPTRSLLISFVIVASLSTVGFARFGDFGRFLTIVRQAEPLWLIVAIVLQVLTYVCAGEVLRVSVCAAGHPLSTRVLARLSVERLTIDQFMPTGGIAGHIGAIQAMRHFGLRTAVAMEALLLDILSHHAAFAAVALLAFGILSLHNGVTPILLATLIVFAAITTAIPIVVLLFLLNPSLIGRLPRQISKQRIVSRLLDVLARVSPDRILDWRTFLKATFFQTAIFVLDGATLWAVLLAIGVHVSPGAAFSVFVIATVVGTVSFIPGGVGTFEVGSVTTLVGFGVPFEGALAGTLLLRGLTLWIPLIPGSILAHQDLAFGNRPDANSR